MPWLLHVPVTHLYDATFPDSSSINNNHNSLPWSPKQEWALRDNISKYSVFLLTSRQQLQQQQQPISDHKNGKVVLWRTMVREITELSGYDIPRIQSQYQLLTLASSDSDGLILSDILLPFIDQYEFQIHGGVSGFVYGMKGILDGTRIQTSSLIQSEYTIPRGYIQTQDECIAYELGSPLGQTNTGDRRMIQEQNLVSLLTAKNTLDTGARGTDVVTKAILSLAQPWTGPIIILTGAAVLVHLLSHHLTVNVFWV